MERSRPAGGQAISVGGHQEAGETERPRVKLTYGEDRKRAGASLSRFSAIKSAIFRWVKRTKKRKKEASTAESDSCFGRGG